MRTVLGSLITEEDATSHQYSHSSSPDGLLFNTRHGGAAQLRLRDQRQREKTSGRVLALSHVDVQISHLGEAEEKGVHETTAEGGLAHVLRSDDECDGRREQAGDALQVRMDDETNLRPRSVQNDFLCVEFLCVFLGEGGEKVSSWDGEGLWLKEVINGT